MTLSPVAIDVLYFALAALGDIARLVMAAFVAASFVDGLLSAIQIARQMR